MRPKPTLSVRIMLPVVRAIVFLLGPVRNRHPERVPLDGGLLIFSNHRSDADPVVLQAKAPRYIRFMAKSELFDVPVLGFLMKWAMSFPVRRGEPDRSALKKAAELAKAGWAVGVFPEGQISESGHLEPLKPGVALVARLAGVPCLCVAVKRTEKIIPYGSVTPRPAFGGVEVEWGEPRTFDKSVTPEEFVAWVEAELRRLGAV